MESKHFILENIGNKEVDIEMGSRRETIFVAVNFHVFSLIVSSSVEK